MKMNQTETIYANYFSSVRTVPPKQLWTNQFHLNGVHHKLMSQSLDIKVSTWLYIIKNKPHVKFQFQLNYNKSSSFLFLHLAGGSGALYNLYEMMPYIWNLLRK